jgi:hypothetical protein
MVTKKRAPVAVVTEGAAQAALRRGPARELSPDEEKVMRMRLGASPPRAAPLERVFEERTDLEIEVLAAEIEAFMRLHAREEERRGRGAGLRVHREIRVRLRARRAAADRRAGVAGRALP